MGGDIHSSFESFRNQFAAGLNMGIAEASLVDHGHRRLPRRRPHRPAFQELLARWFQYGAFCPVMRLHGDRYPTQPQQGPPAGPPAWRAQRGVVLWGGGLRDLQEVHVPAERLRPYIKEQMAAAHEKGTPVMRPLFYDFPGDSAAWACEDAYLFGPSLLVAPVMEAGQRQLAMVTCPPAPSGPTCGAARPTRAARPSP